MTKRECAIVMAYTGVAMLQGKDLKWFHDYLREILGEPVLAQEYYYRGLEIKQKSKPDFMMLCKTATEGRNDD